MQALYAWFVSENKSLPKAEQELMNGAERTYDLYLLLLLLITELSEQDRQYHLDVTSKFLVQKKKVIKTLSDNRFTVWLNSNTEFKSLIKKRGLSWQDDFDTIKNCFHQVKNSEEYNEYISQPFISTENDIKFWIDIYKHIIEKSEVVQHGLEEKNIYWAESIGFINSMVLKTIKSAKQDVFELLPLYKDSDDDKSFMKKLFHEVVSNDATLMEMISPRIKNWEVDRIALMDTILIKMALTEVLYFSNIPVKVSINEYIDISKEFSTPKSKDFINGVVDKIVIDLRNENKIQKSGRGLVEN